MVAFFFFFYKKKNYIKYIEILIALRDILKIFEKGTFSPLLILRPFNIND